MQKMTTERILAIAALTELRVPVYSWGAEALRKKTRRMFKDGLLVLVARERHHFVYRTPARLPA